VIKAHFDSLGLAQLLSHKSGYSNPGEPRTTSYILYEKTTGQVAYRGHFNGLQGGMHVQEGLYDLLVYTTDFNEYDANFFIGMDSPWTAETHTRQSPIDAPELDESGEPVDKSDPSDIIPIWMVEPDPTFSALIEDVAVFKDKEDKLVEVEFVQKSFKYYLTIRATGLHNIHTAKMSISGMFTSAYLTSDEHRMNEAGTQTLDLEIHYDSDPAEDVDNGYMYGEFWAFGPHSREDIVNEITMYFVNGSMYTMKLKDLTPQIKQLTKGGEIIVEEVLDIKGPPSGFQPGVGDWNETDVELVS
jgi:hypothetical protein